MKQKMNLFFVNMNTKRKKVSFFKHNKLKFNLETET